MVTIENLLGVGVEPKNLDSLQMCVRGVVVFLSTLIIVRLAHKRFLARLTAFDTVLAFMLASLLARTINGSAPLLPTLAVAIVLVAMHRILSALSFHSEAFGNLVKGNADVLVQDGKPDLKKMRAHKISKEDLLEEARLNGEVSEIAKIRTATIERNGQISIIPARDELHERWAARRANE